MHAYSEDQASLYSSILCDIARHINIGDPKKVEEAMNYLTQFRIKTDYNDVGVLTIQGVSVFDTVKHGPKLTLCNHST